MKAATLKHSFVISRGRLFLLALLIIPATLSFGQSERNRASVSPPDQTTLSTQSQDPVIVDTNLVSVIVTVTDSKGTHISGLDKNDFQVYEDQLPQQITFFSDADAPVSLGVVFDVSNSMTGEKIISARDGLSRFVETSHRADDYFLITVNDRAQLLLDSTRDAESMLSSVTSLRPHGETALYDAIYLAIEKVASGSKTRRAILLITDGIDTASRYSMKELRRSLQESDLVVYAVGILGFSRSESVHGRSTLNELTSITGGKAFFPRNDEELISAFEQIALEMRSQYSIGFRASDVTGSRKWHRIKVDLAVPQGSRTRVRTREGFFAP